MERVFAGLPLRDQHQVLDLLARVDSAGCRLARLVGLFVAASPSEARFVSSDVPPMLVAPALAALDEHGWRALIADSSVRWATYPLGSLTFDLLDDTRRLDWPTVCRQLDGPMTVWLLGRWPDVRSCPTDVMSCVLGAGPGAQLSCGIPWGWRVMLCSDYSAELRLCGWLGTERLSDDDVDQVRFALDERAKSRPLPVERAHVEKILARHIAGRWFDVSGKSATQIADAWKDGWVITGFGRGDAAAWLASEVAALIASDSLGFLVAQYLVKWRSFSQRPLAGLELASLVSGSVLDTALALLDGWQGSAEQLAASAETVIAS